MSHYVKPMAEPADLCTDRIERRVAGRQMAADLMALIDADKLRDPHFVDAMTERLRAEAFPPDAQSPEKPAAEPIGRLGNIFMPFGQYKDKTLDETPLEYLDWLCASQENFYRDLRAYLKHPDLESRRRGVEP